MSPVRPQARGSISSPLVKIVLAWLVALALALGHDAFYKSLNNKVAPSAIGTSISSEFDVHSQAGASAIGTMFAWLVAAALGLSAGTAFIQCAWVVVQQRATSVSGLDALWSSPKNALAFLSLDMWRSAHAVVLVSALAWAFPLIVTFAPGTLSVRTQTVFFTQGCNAATYDFGNNDLLYNASPFYLRPSTLAQRIVGGVLLSGQHLTPTSMCGTNCSYTIKAYAPYFNCSSSSFNASVENSVGKQAPPYNATSFDSSPSQNEYGEGGSGQISQLGWDFSAALSNYAFFQPDPTSGLAVTCIAYNASYFLDYDFNNGPNVSILDVEPVQMATQFKDLNPPPNDPDFIDGLPSNPHTAFYNATTNYYAVFQTLYSYIVGNVTVKESTTVGSWDVTPDTLLLPATAFVATPSSAEPQGNFSWRASPDFPTAMQDLLTNISISLLVSAVDSDPSQITQTTCTFTDTLPHFLYNRTRLWLIYSLGLGGALLCDLAGLWALWRNRFGGSADFSEFLRATRSRELNHLDLSDAQGVRLQYGPVGSEGGRYAFATPESLRAAASRDGDGEELHLKSMSTMASPGLSYEPFSYEQNSMSAPHRHSESL
uniref:Uncharacterized protein n=1 Tax=Mycena chlorophos TaxID=658473 RepID=A0ABQ0MAQ5_MYCCL|nr:predicted protein [Mycena chlorophos]